MILHPAVLTKSAKLVPREQMHTMVAIGADTPVLGVIWPKKYAVKPLNLQSRVVSIRELCEKFDDMLPVTYARGKAEPQMIAEHKLERDVLNYQINIPDELPILVGTRCLVGTYSGLKDIAKIKGTIDVPCLRHVRGNQFKVERKTAEIKRVNEVTLTIRMSVWDQPDRVEHTQAYLVTGSGLVLG